jgi:protein O-GlcNAc transferase
LPVFAQRAAPVQASWLGFPATTGVPAMDWLIADSLMVPPGAEGEFTERVARLATVAWCYTPPDDAPAVAQVPPASARGHVTFASFSNPAKLNEGLLACWAALLEAVPGSRLLLKYLGLDDAIARDRIVAIMARHGVGAARLAFAGWTPHVDMLAAYGEVDVALDPFPFAGATTTLEALWMGVPVVTLEGATMAGRTSAALLRAAGLAKLVAKDSATYVALASALARDRNYLAALRGGLRSGLAASPVMDGGGFSRTYEALLRGLWRDWLTRV